MKDFTASKDPLTELKKTIALLERHRDGINKALEYGGSVHTFEYVCGRVLSGTLDVIELPNSVMFGETIEYESCRVYNLFLGCGNLGEILAFEPVEIHHVAAKNHCNYITFSGREGWVKPLKALGWKTLNVTMMHEVRYDV